MVQTSEQTQQPQPKPVAPTASSETVKRASNTDRPQSSGSGWITLLASLLLVIAIVGVLGSIAYGKWMQIQAASKQPPPPEMAISVRLTTATSGKLSLSTNVVGTVLAPRTITLRNEEPGTVTEVLMKPGEEVKKGEVLVRMDTRVEQAELNAAIATLAQAESALKRAQRLANTNSLSAEQLDSAVAAAARATAEKERLSAIIDRKTLRAPFLANVGLFQLHPGQYLDVGRELVNLEGIDEFLLVDFAVPAHVADNLEPGSEVQMSIDGGSSQLPAQISAMDARSDSESRLMLMRSKLSGAPKQLLPGDSVVVNVPFGEPRDVVVVPRTAIRRGPAGTSVFIAEKDPDSGQLRARFANVDIAATDDTSARLLSGVEPGDKVIADGSFKVFPGALLKDAEAKAVEETDQE